MLNVQRLRILREVIGRGSFSEAATALDYTQSAVSQAVATLEAEVGATLIERDRRELRPTPVGPARGALLPRGGLRAHGVIRERRLPNGAGTGGGGRRGGADTRARALERSRRHRRAVAVAREPGPAGRGRHVPESRRRAGRGG